MGCIVNGPGEMADADFGYVGGAPGKVNLYVGKKAVKFNIPELKPSTGWSTSSENTAAGWIRSRRRANNTYRPSAYRSILVPRVLRLLTLTRGVLRSKEYTRDAYVTMPLPYRFVATSSQTHTRM